MQAKAYLGRLFPTVGILFVKLIATMCLSSYSFQAIELESASFSSNGSKIPAVTAEAISSHKTQKHLSPSPCQFGARFVSQSLH